MIKDIADSRRANAHIHASDRAASTAGVTAGSLDLGPRAVVMGIPTSESPLAMAGVESEQDVVMGIPTTDSPFTQGEAAPQSSGGPRHLEIPPLGDPPQSLHGYLPEGATASVSVGDVEMGSSEGGGPRTSPLAGFDFSAAIVSHLFWPKPDPRNKEKVSFLCLSPCPPHFIASSTLRSKRPNCSSRLRLGRR